MGTQDTGSATPGISAAVIPDTDPSLGADPLAAAVPGTQDTGTLTGAPNPAPMVKKRFPGRLEDVD